MPTFPSDSDFTDQTPTGGDVIHRPFLNVGNLANYMVERVVLQDLAEHATPAMGTTATADHGPVEPLGDPLYLIDESPIDRGMALSRNAKARCTRLWAPEWADITEYTSLNFPLPDFRGLVHTGVAFAYEEDYRRLRIATTATVDTITQDLADGTFTYTDPDGSGTTAAIDPTDTAANILTALQTVDSNVTAVTQKNYGFQVLRTYLTGTEAAAEAADFIFTGVSGDPAVTIENVSGGSDTDQTLEIYRGTIAVADVAHPFATGDLVSRVSIGSYTAAVTVVDADNFTFPRSSDPVALLATYSSPLYRILYWYVRTKNIPARVVHQFYIPGVTAGITTAADIPAVAVVDHDYALLEAIAAGTAEITAQASDLAHPYPGVYTRQLIKITTRDLYDAS